MRSNLRACGRIAPFLALLLLPLAAGPAAGGVFEGNGEVGFDVGWVDLDGRDGGDEGRVTIRGGYHLNDLFQLEGQLFAIGTAGPYNVDTVSGIFANAVFNFHPGETVIPYVLVGLGVVETESFLHFRCHGYPGRPGRPCYGDDHRYRGHDDHEASGAIQVGAGARFFFGRSRTAVRLEASVMACEDDFDRDRELLSLSAGLTWRLGKRRPPKVTVAGGSDRAPAPSGARSGEEP